MDEIQRLIMQVEGEAKILALTKDLDAQKQIMMDLVAEYKAGQVSLAQYEQAMEKAATVAAPLAAQIKETQKSIGNLGPVLMQTGYVVDDFVAGLNNQGLAGALANIQNNIPGFLASFGVGGTVAAGLGVVAVAVAQLVRHWDELMEALGRNDLAKRVEEMQALAKSAQDIVDANTKLAQGVKGKGETDRGSAFRKALEEFGGGQKLLDQAGPRADQKAAVADAIAKALQGSEGDIGFLAGGNQKLREILERPVKQAMADIDDAMGKLAEDFKAKDASLTDALNKQGQDNMTAADQDAAGARAKAIKDTMKAARNVVRDKPGMLPQQPLMDYAVNSQEDIDALQQQAAQMANDIDQGQAAGLDMTRLIDEFQRLRGAVAQQQRQFDAVRQQMSGQMGGQMGGGGFSQLPMYQGGQ